MNAIEPYAGWHPDPYGHPCMRYYDGTQWTGHTSAPQAATPAAAPIAVAIAGGGSNGIGAWHLLHLALTVLTAGIWLPVWIIHAIVGRRRGGNNVTIQR